MNFYKILKSERDSFTKNYSFFSFSKDTFFSVFAGFVFAVSDSKSALIYNLLLSNFDFTVLKSVLSGKRVRLYSEYEEDTSEFSSLSSAFIMTSLSITLILKN